MTAVTVVTSMSKDIYEGYGQDFLRTFRQHVKGVDCVVYVDGDISDYGYVKDDCWDFSFLSVSGVTDHDKWMAQIAPFKLMSGDIDNGKYDIQFDARQARKAFIEMHAGEVFGGKVFWIDSDVIFHADVPKDFWDKCLPDDKLNCYLGRDGWFYTESGFIGWNAGHPGFWQFPKAYRNVYLTGAIFTQRGWHDCIGFDILRNGLPKKFFKNLAEGLPHGTMHPFINSPLGAYMDHRKGGRKKTRSTKEDLVIERSEPYWQFVVE